VSNILGITFSVAALAFATQSAAQVTLYENDGFTGRQFTANQQVANIDRYGFNDRASSIVVVGNRWEVCEDARFNGRCVVLRPGRYPSMASMRLNDRVSSLRMVGANVHVEDNRYAPWPAPEGPHVTFYENEGFTGRSFTASQQIGNFERYGFNDRASSAIVLGERWEVCEGARFSARCVVLRPGRYPSLAAMGLNDRVSSVRAVSTTARVDDGRYSPAPVAAYDNRRRRNERIYEANVTSVRAVVGTPEQRCWIEREQVTSDRGNANVPGALVGALIGGVLGHQIGGGRGKDFATVGGAVAGGLVGANIGQTAGEQQTQDVQRCAAVPRQTHPEFWDVTYSFRGQEYRMQVTTPPGPTVTVNDRGEPRA
jgi:uncharacterized protein YcfJ